MACKLSPSIHCETFNQFISQIFNGFITANTKKKKQCNKENGQKAAATMRLGLILRHTIQCNIHYNKCFPLANLGKRFFNRLITMPHHISCNKEFITKKKKQKKEATSSTSSS